MRFMYFLLGWSMLVLAVWYSMAGWMIYIIGKDAGLWAWIWSYIDRWIKWRYGW